MWIAYIAAHGSEIEFSMISWSVLRFVVAIKLIKLVWSMKQMPWTWLS